MNQLTINSLTFRLVGWLLAALAAGAMLWSTQPWGAGVTGDTVGYIRTAVALADGQGWLYHSALYPPLFPLLLAPFPFFGIDPLVGGRYLEAGLFAAILVAAWHWMLSNLQTRAAALIGLLALASSGPMVEAAWHVLTEIPFILTMTLALLAADRYWRGGARSWLLVFAVFCALSSSLRYVGVTLVMAGGVLILVRPGIALLERFKQMVLFGAVSASLTFMWLARNWLVDGTFLGSRTSSVEPPTVSLGRSWQVTSSWVWPPNAWDTPLFSAAAVGLIVAVVAALAVLFLSRQRATVPITDRPVAFAVFLPLYLVFIILIKLKIGNMEPRYLTPAVVPLFLLAAYGLDRCLLRCRGLVRGRRPLAVAVVSGLSIWLLSYSLVNAAMDLRFHHDHGYHFYICYNSELWQSTDSVAMLKKRELSGVVYSNMPRVAYLYSGLASNRIPTAANLDDAARREAFRQRVTESLAGPDPVHLLYLRNPHTGQLDNNPAALSQLKELITLTPQWLAPDGSAALLRITATQPTR
jgi:hypothetical protein